MRNDEQTSEAVILEEVDVPQEIEVVEQSLGAIQIGPIVQTLMHLSPLMLK